MGFDLAAAGILDAIFGAGDVAAADIGAGAVAGDLAAGAGAADLAAGAGAAGAADVAAGAGAADLAATAAPAALDVGAAAPGVTDALTSAAPGLDAIVPAAVDTASVGGLGTEIGGGVSDALSFAPTSADAAAATGTAAAGPGTSAVPGLLEGSSATAAGGTVAPAEELAGSQAINTELGVDTAVPPASGPTSQQFALAQSDIPGAPVMAQGSDVPGTIMNADRLAAQQAAGAGDLTGQIAGEGGMAPTSTSEALANAPVDQGSFPAADPARNSLTSVQEPGLLDSTGSVLSNPLVKAGELALPLGFIAYNAIKGPAPIPPQAQEAVQNATAQLPGLQNQAMQNVPLYNKTAAQDINLANNFQINPAQAASIAQWKQDQMNQLYQQVANTGQTNVQGSSAFLQGKNQIDQQALAMQVQMINQLISTAFQASSAANAGVSTATNVTQALDSTLMQAAQLQVQQDQAFQQAIGSALQSFGLMAALSNVGGSKAA